MEEVIATAGYECVMLYYVYDQVSMKVPKYSFTISKLELKPGERLFHVDRLHLSFLPS